MTLIKSISGIRGTIGGKAGDNLTPPDIVKFVTGYARYIRQTVTADEYRVVIGRDARLSGPVVSALVIATLQSLGFHVTDLGLSTTPTVELAVAYYKAQGGIIITASHNPGQWNALKLLNQHGEFLDAEAGREVLELAGEQNAEFCSVETLGKLTEDHSFIDKHIDMVLALPLVDTSAIAAAQLHVAVDAVNSTGGIALPALLKKLGVARITGLYCTPDGNFPHNPEPLPEHLGDLSRAVTENGAHLGFVVDPDVDRLAIVCENGAMFGEEYTLVAVADYVLAHTPGNTVSNMSSTRALRDITEARGLSYSASAVGEVNVVEMMKSTHAVIGGEGNGGVIYPELHYGRDALVGVALFLSHLAKSKLSCSQLRASYPEYTISKNKISFADDVDVTLLLRLMEEKYKHLPHSTIDGLKVEFDKEWVHLRKSNTEPIVRIYAESSSAAGADRLAAKVMQELQSLV